MFLPGARAADSPPLRPESPEAREWLERELAEREYQDQQSPLDQLVEWLAERLDTAPSGAVPTPVLVLLLVLVLAGLVVVLVRGLRGDVRVTTPDASEVFDGAEERTALGHRRAARTALSAGDHRRAVLEAFRGMARDGVERTLVAPSPGLTVREVVLALSAAFPTKGAALTSVGTAFDRARYGDGAAGAGAAQEAVTLAEELAETRPRLPEVGMLSAAGDGR